MENNSHQQPSVLMPIRSARQRIEDAKAQPDILQLLGPVWHSGEVAILFADTGVGKSIFSIQLGDRLSKGLNVSPSLVNQCDPQTVLYYDFELSDKQFQKRYQDERTGQTHDFSPDFYIDNIDFVALFDSNPKLSLLDSLFQKFRNDIATLGAKVVIIDNITFLNTQTTQDQQASLDIMRKLIELKREFNLSILVLAHMPKRAENTPITISDVSGSKHLPNFADTVFSIGKSSKGPQNRYLKQVKPSRSCEPVYHAGNVLEFGIDKEGAFLQFIEIGTNSESENLSVATDDPKILAMSMKNSNPGMSIRDIAKKVGYSKSSVAEWLKESPHWAKSVKEEMDEPDNMDRMDTHSKSGQHGQAGQIGQDKLGFSGSAS